MTDREPLKPEIWYALNRVENLVQSTVVIGRRSQAEAMAAEFGCEVTEVVVVEAEQLRKLVEATDRASRFVNSLASRDRRTNETMGVMLSSLIDRELAPFLPLLETKRG